MPSLNDHLAFALVAFTMVCTPGPNMIYLISRSLCQGPRAGMISLVGVAAAFVLYMILAALGITALLMTVPFAYDALRMAGAASLLWLAWQAVRPGGRSPFEVRDLAPDSPAKLVVMGFMTNLLNPKAAVLYLSLLPHFMRPERGDLLTQGLVLGGTQIAISFAVNSLVIVTAGSVASILARKPSWQRAQRWFMGMVLGGLALRMATAPR